VHEPEDTRCAEVIQIFLEYVIRGFLVPIADRCRRAGGVIQERAIRSCVGVCCCVIEITSFRSALNAGVPERGEVPAGTVRRK